MVIDPLVVELGSKLVLEDEGMVNDALLEIAELLNLWAASAQTNESVIPSSEANRGFLRKKLLEHIDRDPTDPSAATAIWVLGKLYDSSLEPYLANLAGLFLNDDQRSWHLRQTVIALDNLDVLPARQLWADGNDLSDMRRIIADYLQDRHLPRK